jgi:hypothetical protein
MELSLLCDVKLMLFIFDKNGDSKLMHYQSDPHDDYIELLFRDCCNPKNYFCNDHYQHLTGGNASQNGLISMSAGESSSICGPNGLLPLQQHLQSKADMSQRNHF